MNDFKGGDLLDGIPSFYYTVSVACRYRMRRLAAQIRVRVVKDMIFKPKQLGDMGLDPEQLAEDKKKCRKIGPCGVGQKAIYLNSFYIDRQYYVPFASVKRMFKRVALSRGGFSGKGLFASIPYLVVEFDNGKQKQCNFKHEEQVDRMLEYVGKSHPGIPLHSVEAEKKLNEKAKQLSERKARIASAQAKDEIEKLERAAAYLEKRPQLYQELSAASKRKRTYERSNPAYKWVAVFIMLLGAGALIYGIYALMTHAGMALYFLLFGLAAIFLFSSANVLPTARNNRRAIEKRLADAEAAMERHISAYDQFPLPARYAHPAVLSRMIEVLAYDRAADADTAFETVKKDLQAINSSVTVEQEEYDEIMAIKPMFLVHNYE